ncbi:MAG: glycosyltransferase family 4 protein [Pseudonocardiales bacterium]
MIWHGYLLGGTGSNVYTRSLARAWQLLGHDVTVVSQEPRPELFDLGGAATVRPDIGDVLPVFVMDRYEGVAARRLPDLSVAQREEFVRRNASALRRVPADFVLANHVLLGAPVGAASGLPFAVKAHGSELEFAMRGNADLCAWALDTLAGARLVVAGSEHIRTVLDEVPGRGSYSHRVRVIPPGVDVEALVPAERGPALTALLAECRLDPPNPPDSHDERRPDAGNAERLAEFLDSDDPVVLYVGKLSAEKGVSLLLQAVSRLTARAVIVGFGPARAALAAQVRESGCVDRVLFTGPLEHRHLRHLWPVSRVGIVPSIFPEAFGMVAAEAASCGCPPLVARHSGLAEIADGLSAEYPERYRHLTGFRSGDVDDLTARLGELLALRPPEWARLSAAARRAVQANWGWQRVAGKILAGMAGSDN